MEHEDCPELLQDKYWEECIPKEIPYTVGAEKYKKDEFVGSAEQTLTIKDADKVSLNLKVQIFKMTHCRYMEISTTSTTQEEYQR